MRLLIDLPDKVYNRIKSIYGHNQCCGLRLDDMKTVVTAIIHGKKIPKDHGALKDLSHINNLVGFKSLVQSGSYKEALKIILDRIDKLPVIVESTKE